MLFECEHFHGAPHMEPHTLSIHLIHTATGEYTIVPRYQWCSYIFIWRVNETKKQKGVKYYKWYTTVIYNHLGIGLRMQVYPRVKAKLEMISQLRIESRRLDLEKHKSY